MNQPWIYMCSPFWSPLLPPSTSDPSGSSQCTSPEHLSHATNLGWWSVSPLIVYLFQCYSLRTSHPSVLSWRLHITNSWDPGAAKCPLRYLWLAFSIIYQVSPFWYLSFSILSPSQCPFSFSLFFSHRLPGTNLFLIHLDFIILQPFLGTKSGLSLVGWLADSWLEKQLSHSHLPMALV